MTGMPPSASIAPVLTARGLTVTRPGDAGPLRVLDSIDLTLAVGTLTDVVGPSGSGKTTLLLALSRLLPEVEGALSLAGVPAAEVDASVWRTRVAYLPQRSALLSGTVLDNLLLPWRLKVRAAEAAPTPEQLRAALGRVRMDDVALDRSSTRLSEGQCARVALLRTVLTRPEVLLLDEPDASLDNESAEQVGLLTSEFVAGGGAVVRVRHLRSDDRADRRLHLESGRLTEAS